MATASSLQTSSSSPPPPQQQSGSSATATTSFHGTTRLSFDDVAKHFNVPIAEAATALGVCSSVLKRICRENGVIRWPYRKILAGKTVDDIKKDASREKSKESTELSKIARDRTDKSASTHSALAFPASTLVTSHAQEVSKLQKGFCHPGYVPEQQGCSLFQEGHSIFQPFPSIPNYVDEFKYGFPVDGLSLAAPQWWGGCSSESTGKSICGEPPCEDEEPQAEEPSLSPPDKTKEPRSECGPASSLCSIRKRAVMYGEESIKLGTSRGYGAYKLAKRERPILIQVFKSSLPHQWKYSFS